MTRGALRSGARGAAEVFFDGLGEFQQLRGSPSKAISITVLWKSGEPGGQSSGSV